MNELIVIGYDTPKQAEAARTELFGMAKEYLVDVADAVVATADEEGKIKLDQMVNLWSVGAASGAMWGVLAGLLFFNPFLGAAVGAGAGALSGALSDYGINDNFMKDVSNVLQPGQAALFMMVRTEATDRVIKRLGIKGGHIIRTNLDRSKEEHLRRTFNEMHAGIDGGQATQAPA
ncbi:DUF1269 domain-containing protein [Phaeobacter sp. HF9A]|uniref:DUF1269 domain-containing protein n=1 Tax=Phaeobacter sp. HF9A TaxID=2721561 RepID=UPI00142FE6FB|nr:DUF1269 domain-containing protein [Phaeobacter sp. HF9A]NIZ12736.1 DUF1269 domain-containing protein [Phaeobacter sp. HF9A]